MEKANILIVEDEAVIAMGIESKLYGLGYKVTAIVNSGKKAIAMAEKAKPELILMDIRIKGEIDGIETAEIIRKKFGIPIVFSSAYLDQERIERAKLTMPFGYLLKPIQESDLKITLEMALYISKVDEERKKVEQSIEHRLELEKLGNDISTSFINAKHSDIDTAINLALKKISHFAGANRGSLFIISENQEELTNTHEWCEDPADSQVTRLQATPFSNFKWQEQLAHHETIKISSPEDYLPEENGKMNDFNEHSFRSMLVVPLLKQGQLYGSLGFYGEQGKKVTWSSEFIGILKTFGNIILNVLEHKKSEEMLRESEDWLRQTLKYVPDQVLMLTPDGTIKFVNKTLYSDSEKLINTSVFTHLPEASKTKLKQHIDLVLKTGAKQQYEIEFVSPENQTIIYQSIMGPIISGDKIIGLVVINRETTPPADSDHI